MHSAISQPNKYLIHKLLFSVLDHVLLQSTPKGGFNSHKFVCVRVRGGGCVCMCVAFACEQRCSETHILSSRMDLCLPPNQLFQSNEFLFCFFFWSLLSYCWILLPPKFLLSCHMREQKELETNSKGCHSYFVLNMSGLVFCFFFVVVLSFVCLLAYVRVRVWVCVCSVPATMFLSPSHTPVSLEG